MDYWHDKVALVTGGSSGLGRSLARCFARRGAKVVIAARSQERAEEAVGRIVADGGEAICLPTDVTRQDDVDAMLAGTIDRFGKLDALVNCAGRSDRGEALQATPEKIAELMELNFLAAVRCTRAAAEHLIQSRGHLINIGSLASKTVSRYLGAYPPGKFALAAYSQQLRLELAPQGVGVLLVCPGPIRRDDAGSRYDEQAENLPESARRPGAGVKLKGLDPERLAERVLRAARKRKKELIAPGKAKLLFVLAALSPTLGDWIVKKNT